MLKDFEELIKKRKLSSLANQQIPVTTQVDDTVTAATTPPITPPTPPPPPTSGQEGALLSSSSSTVASALSLTLPLPLPLPISLPLPPSTVALFDMLATATPPQQHAVNATQNPANINTPPTLTPTSMAASLLQAHNAATTSQAASTSTASATHIASTTSTAATTSMGNGQVQDHYSLRWNNHQNHILRAFDALLQTKALVDVTLVCAETSIRAHKMVLSACSPFFQRVFAETPCKHPVIVLKDFRGWVVQAIVDFMYRGEISVPQERLQTLIQAAESLQVRGLVESSVPEHTPTPAASPDDFGMIDTSLMSSEMERCSSFDEESPSMVTSGSKIILPSRLFGSSIRRERDRERQRERKREREREREMEMDRDVESDQELTHELNLSTDLCTSPMPRRKQARPRRRSGDIPPDLPSKPTTPIPQEASTQQEPMALHKENLANNQIDSLQTVIKKELAEPMDEDDANRKNDEGDSKNDHESNENHGLLHDQLNTLENLARTNANLISSERNGNDESHGITHNLIDDNDHEESDRTEFGHDSRDQSEDIDEIMKNSNAQMRHKQHSPALSDGPEDLCTTKKDTDTSGNHSASDTEGSPTNNNNNSKLNNNNNNRIVLSLKDIRQLNKPSSSSTPNANNNMNPFAAANLRDLRLDRAANMAENHCKMDSLEAQMHAAAAAAAAAAANGENPFQHMEHQMDLSLAAAAAAAAVSRDRDREAMQREQRELQQQHNAYANSILGQMGMPGIPPFGSNGPPGSGGPAPHERLEESMNRLTKDFAPSSPMSLPSHFNQPDGPPHPPSPLPFPGMSSALALTPPHMFGLDSPLGLFPPGIDPGKLYNPLMEMSDPRGMGQDPPPFLKKKMPRPKGQHSAPRGGPPRSWTNAELTEALQHVWNKKMTTSQASRIFGIPYNSLLMYVRGKYGKSLKLEQLRKDCISGPPLELLQMGVSSNNGGSGNGGSKNGNGGANNGESRDRDSRKDRKAGSSSGEMHMNEGGPSMPGGPGGCPSGGGPRSSSSEPDLLGGPNSIFNPFPPGFYPDFPGGFPGLPLGMLNLLPPTERHQQGGGMHHLGMDEDCKSDRSKHSMDDEFGSAMGVGMQPLALEQRRSGSGSVNGSDIMPGNGTAGAIGTGGTSSASANGGQANGNVQD